MGTAGHGIDAELARLKDDELSVKVRGTVAVAVADNNKGALGRYLNALKKREPKEVEGVTNA
jgi:hypothetical protein